MGKVNKKIKENFKIYMEIVSKLKSPMSGYISLLPGKGAHRKYLLGEVGLDFVRKFKGRLSIRQAKSHLADYGFQVFADFFDKPILRFDADGTTHYNSRDERIPLLEREIKTPHFHRFDKTGVEYAYKTTFLNENEYQVQNDVQVGLNHFCDENLIISNSDKRDFDTQPVIKINTQTEMFPEDITNDVHKGVKFI